MFFRWYRRKIAEAVETKMCYMGSCPNEKEIVLCIIAPKTINEQAYLIATRIVGTQRARVNMLTGKADFMKQYNSYLIPVFAMAIATLLMFVCIFNPMGW